MVRYQRCGDCVRVCLLRHNKWWDKLGIPQAQGWLCDKRIMWDVKEENGLMSEEDFHQKKLHDDSKAKTINQRAKDMADLTLETLVISFIKVSWIFTISPLLLDALRMDIAQSGQRIGVMISGQRLLAIWKEFLKTTHDYAACSKQWKCKQVPHASAKELIVLSSTFHTVWYKTCFNRESIFLKGNNSYRFQKANPTRET